MIGHVNQQTPKVTVSNAICESSMNAIIDMNIQLDTVDRRKASAIAVVSGKILKEN